MTVTVPLSRGLVALISDCDAEKVLSLRWQAKPSGVNPKSTFYAVSSVGGLRARKMIYLHRLVLNAQPGEMFDHINRDGLDCRRENLRPASASMNGVNRIFPPRKGLFRGVHPNTGGWMMKIRINGTQIYRGGFRTPEDAAAEYDRLAREHHGVFAILNFPMIEERRLREISGGQL